MLLKSLMKSKTGKKIDIIEQLNHFVKTFLGAIKLTNNFIKDNVFPDKNSLWRVTKTYDSIPGQ